MIPGAIKMLTFLTRAGLRQTKRLSAFKSAVIPKTASPLSKGTKWAGKKGTTFYTIKSPGTLSAGAKGGQLRTWSSLSLKGLEKAGLSATKRRQALYGYQRGYKHVAKHKKLYGAGVAGAAIWDFLPGKDNPKA